MRDLIRLLWYSYGITQVFVQELQRLYPDVDIKELLLANEYTLHENIDSWIKVGRDNRGIPLMEKE